MNKITLRFLLPGLLFITGFIIAPFSTFAGEPPVLLSPANSSTVTTSALNWQAPAYQLYSSSPYRVQVDDDSAFASLNKDYYTDNTHYTPTLNVGTWFWRVKAKDSSGAWSNWSEVWSFNLVTSNPTIAPTTSPAQSTPTPIPVSTPNPVPNSSSNSTPSPSSSFTISNVPTQIDPDQSFSVSADLSLPNNPNTTFYLKGAFKKEGSSNYFGKTKVSGSWVKNSASYSTQYQITTDVSGKWLGNLEVMPDADDSGYKGTDDYTFKIGRYSQSGSGPTWSNEETIKIVDVSSNSQTDSPSSSDNSGSPTKPVVNSTPSSSNNKATSKITKSSSTQLVYRTASVAGATTSAVASATPVTNIEVKSGNKINFIPWIGALLIFSGIVSLIFIYLRSKKDL